MTQTATMKDNRHRALLYRATETQTKDSRKRITTSDRQPHSAIRRSALGNLAVRNRCRSGTYFLATATGALPVVGNPKRHRLYGHRITIALLAWFGSRRRVPPERPGQSAGWESV